MTVPESAESTSPKSVPETAPVKTNEAHNETKLVEKQQLTLTDDPKQLTMILSRHQHAINNQLTAVFSEYYQGIQSLYETIAHYIEAEFAKIQEKASHDIQNIAMIEDQTLQLRVELQALIDGIGHQLGRS